MVLIVFKDNGKTIELLKSLGKFLCKQVSKSDGFHVFLNIITKAI
jgi:hypothetical protein